MMDGQEQTTQSRGRGRPDGETDIDAAFCKLRSDVRIVFWMTSASLVMTIILLIAVFSRT